MQRADRTSTVVVAEPLSFAAAIIRHLDSVRITAEYLITELVCRVIFGLAAHRHTLVFVD